MDKRTFAGKTLDDALSQAAKAFGTERSLVSYDVVSAEGGGLFSKLFSRGVRIQAWVESDTGDLQAAAREAVLAAIGQGATRNTAVARSVETGPKDTSSHPRAQGDTRSKHEGRPGDKQGSRKEPRAERAQGDSTPRAERAQGDTARAERTQGDSTPRAQRDARGDAQGARQGRDQARDPNREKPREQNREPTRDGAPRERSGRDGTQRNGTQRDGTPRDGASRERVQREAGGASRSPRDPNSRQGNEHGNAPRPGNARREGRPAEGAGAEPREEGLSFEAPGVRDTLEDFTGRFLAAFHVPREMAHFEAQEGGDLVLQVDDEFLESELAKTDKLGLAFEHVFKRVAQKRHGDVASRVLLNAGEAQERRAEKLREMAFGLADKVKKTGKTITLGAKSAQERRVIHLALDGQVGVGTRSVGTGENRKLVIFSTDKGGSSEGGGAPKRDGRSRRGRRGRGGQGGQGGGTGGQGGGTGAQGGQGGGAGGQGGQGSQGGQGGVNGGSGPARIGGRADAGSGKNEGPDGSEGTQGSGEGVAASSSRDEARVGDGAGESRRGRRRRGGRRGSDALSGESASTESRASDLEPGSLLRSGAESVSASSPGAGARDALEPGTDARSRRDDVPARSEQTVDGL